MSHLTPKPAGHPIKLVRDRTPQVINASGVPGTLFYESIPVDERLPWLQRKLGEELTEYLVDPGPEELCDVYAVVRALGYLHGLKLADLEIALEDDPRGGFRNGIMMYGHHAEFDGAA
jgi:predicted house-cleaning noncanonical NTP pyrophosphatase (MazG superfamily)